MNTTFQSTPVAANGKKRAGILLARLTREQALVPGLLPLTQPKLDSGGKLWVVARDKHSTCRLLCELDDVGQEAAYATTGDGPSDVVLLEGYTLTALKTALEKARAGSRAVRAGIHER